MAGMVLYEFLDYLGSAGIVATESQLRYGMARGMIARPPKDAIGNYVFSRRHADQVRQYLRTARPGRPPLQRTRKSTPAR